MRMTVTHETAKKIMQTELDGSGYTINYKKTIIRAFKSFLNWIKEKSIMDLSLITKHDLYDYQNYLLGIVSKQTGKLLANSTLCDMYNAVKLLFSALCRAEFLQENITSAINFELPKRKGLERQAFTDEEMAEILEKMDTNTKIGLRDRALFELIYSSGLRVSEASKLTVKDISFEQREMIVRGKFARDRIVPFSKIAYKYLVLYLGNRVYNKDEPVFCRIYGSADRKAMIPNSIGRRFTELLKKYDMKKDELSTHSIRHASASELLNNGAGIRQVQELLGHRNPETTVRYTHTQGDMLAKIYRKYHPQEHDLFDAVDDDYMKRFNKVFGVKAAK